MALFSASFIPFSTAHAHRLEAEPVVRVRQEVKIESWFDLTGESPKGARVEVFRAGSSEPILEGELDEMGKFTFYADLEPLRVVVSAGDGHRKELDVQPPVQAGSNTPHTTAALPNADRNPRVKVADILAGIGFLLAVAAFVTSLRNARLLRELKAKASV